MVSCSKKHLTFQEKEIAILREAIDKVEKTTGKKIVNTPEVQKMISILEDFLRKKKLICYGGTAINNILPIQEQFYDKDIEIPDYDFFSPNALSDAKELADLYVNAGFEEVEAKSGMHYGTYKVFVNFIPIADITFLTPKIFKSISKEAIKVDNIYYAPPNYLRMAMYLELSRPAGDVSRWEKVLKRLILLNKNYPLKANDCESIDFIRNFDVKDKNINKIYKIVRQSFIDQGVVFFGGYASSLYGKYMPKYQKKQISKIPDFDVLSENPQRSAVIVKERLIDNGIKNVSIIKRDGIGEIIAPHYEVKVNKETIAFIYEPIACHSYNVINIKGRKIRIATIDTMLSFYLAFIYADRAYYDKDRILCMAEYLFKVQAKNRLEQKGLLKRFSINCYGEQETMESIRANKTKKYKELRDKKNSKEYEEYFLRYTPSTKTKTKTKSKSKSRKSRTTKKISLKPKIKKILNIEI